MKSRSRMQSYPLKGWVFLTIIVGLLAFLVPLDLVSNPPFAFADAFNISYVEPTQLVAPAFSLYDDFSDPQIDASRWTTLERVREIREGKLFSKIRASSGQTDSSNLLITNPESVASLEADVSLVEYEPGGSSPAGRIVLAMYNDGTPGSGSAGDIQGIMALGGFGPTPVAFFVVFKCNDPNCVSTTDFISGSFGAVSLDSVHRLLVRWDGSIVTFGFNGIFQAVDPRPFAPVAGPPRGGFTGLGTRKVPASGEGSVSATFDNVFVNGALYDDFSASDIDPSRWRSQEFIREIQSGKLLSRLRQIGGGNSSNSLFFPNPNGIAGIQAEVILNSISTSGGGLARARLRGNFYNDGLGDIAATIGIGGNGATPNVFYQVFRCNDIDCASSTNIQSHSFGPASLGQTYVVSLEWNGEVFTFTVNGSSELFDPRAEAPVVSPTPNRPRKALQTFKSGTAGGSGSITATFDNVFIKPAGFLSFPLKNKTAFTATINTVFDHSMEQQYCPDGVVTAYTGEEGRSAFGTSNFFVSFASCGSQELHGFKQDVNGTPFNIGGQYPIEEQTDTDTNKTCCFLFYDGHPGYDYRTKDQLLDGTLCPDGTPCSDGRTEVLAAAPGIVTCAQITGCPEGPGEVKIDHQNGYFTIYLHLSQINVGVNQEVSRGQLIGISGDTGANGAPHLHFEVRKNLVPVDPYGWQGEGPDPYTRASNIDLWQ